MSGIQRIQCCLKCKSRHENCHSFCEDYTEERTALSITNKNKNKDNLFTAYANERYTKRTHNNQLRYGQINKGGK
jgi:hypothetical protein